jgi:hypothetical protein
MSTADTVMPSAPWGKLDPAYCTDYLDECIENNVNPVTDEGVTKILTVMAAYPEFFCRTVMPAAFSQPSTYQQADIWRILADQEAPMSAICAWRGIGKTTSTIGFITHSVVFHYHRFIVFVSKTYTHSVTITESVKRELITNRYIKYLFGGLKPSRIDGVDMSFSKDAWFVADPISKDPTCFIVPKGAGQQVHGMNVRIGDDYVRPTLILVDDLEDPLEVYNKDLRDKLWGWFNESLLETVSDYDHPDPTTNRWSLGPGEPPPYRVVFLDTYKHESAAMARILQAPDWFSVRHAQSEFRVVGKDENDMDKLEAFSLIENVISHEQVRAQIVAAEQKGTLDGYIRNRMCLPISPKHAAFRREMFQYYGDEQRNKLKRGPESAVFRFIVVDPARTMHSTSAMTAMAVMAYDVAKGILYLQHMENRRIETYQQPVVAVDLALEYEAKYIYVEDIGLEDHLRHDYYSEVQKRNLPITCDFLKRGRRPTGDFGTGDEAVKRAWASTLQPLFATRRMKLHKSLENHALIETLCAYPKCSYWDMTDVLSYAQPILERHGYYMPLEVDLEDPTTPKFSDDPDYQKLGRDIQAGNWRTA